MIDETKLIDGKYYVIFVDPSDDAEEPTLAKYDGGFFEDSRNWWELVEVEEVRGPVDWKSLPIVTRATKGTEQ